MRRNVRRALEGLGLQQPEIKKERKDDAVKGKFDALILLDVLNIASENKQIVHSLWISTGMLLGLMNLTGQFMCFLNSSKIATKQLETLNLKIQDRNSKP